MRRAPPELRPLIRAGLALLVVLAGATPARAQTTTGAPTSAARARVTAEIGTTRLAGAWVPQAGGALTFLLFERVEVGVAARAALSSPTVRREGSPMRLHFGLAGLTVSALPAPQRWPGLRVGALLGGGNARLTDTDLGALIDADNGFVVEPAVSYERALAPRLTASASASWRIASRFALLGGLRTRDLHGPAGALSLAVGPF